MPKQSPHMLLETLLVAFKLCKHLSRIGAKSFTFFEDIKQPEPKGAETAHHRWKLPSEEASCVTTLKDQEDR